MPTPETASQPDSSGARPGHLGAIPAPGGTAPQHPQGRALFRFTLGAVGVVFGDIGTSPLYAFRECFSPLHGLQPTAPNILGVLSLIFWSLAFVVVVKYLGFILKADNRGEGGIMALLALLFPDRTPSRKLTLVSLGLFGTALLYGDGIITPAISVLSAVEGLGIATSALDRFVVPITVAILFALFSVQERGTARIGLVFGPLMLVWFAVLLGTGLPWIARYPEVLAAANPLHALHFLSNNGTRGLLVLSAVVLAITGAEALYADLGHFGRRPIRSAWFAIVFPALLASYFGQGALLLSRGPSALQSPFFGLTRELLGDWALYPLILLATIATIIASQALISGAYSLTQQAILLGYLPRTHISHTSEETRGQVYVGQVNLLLMIGSITLVLAFQHSSALAGAYGIAVTGTMVITTVLFHFVMRRIWRWRLVPAAALTTLFLLVDLAFLSANLGKVLQGGWIPIGIGAAIFVMMQTWKRGRRAMSDAMYADSMPLGEFQARLPVRRLPRVHGTAVFLALNPDTAPPALLRHIRHNHMLHERVILMTILTTSEPFADEWRRVRILDRGSGILQVSAMYGYMEKPEMSEILIHCLAAGLPLDINDLTFYLGRESLLFDGNSGMSHWRKRLFAFLTRNSRPATDHFGLPADQVIELGSQVSI